MKRIRPHVLWFLMILFVGNVLCGCADSRQKHEVDDPDAVSQRIPLYDAGKGRIVMKDKVVKTDQQWREILSAERYHITREKGTEKPFTGKYHDYKNER